MHENRKILHDFAIQDTVFKHKKETFTFWHNSENKINWEAVFESLRNFSNFLHKFSHNTKFLRFFADSNT